MPATATLKNSLRVFLTGSTGLVTVLAKLRNYISTDKHYRLDEYTDNGKISTLNPRSNTNNTNSKDKTSAEPRDCVDHRCFQED